MKKVLLSVAVLATVFTSCEKEANVVGKGTLEFTPLVSQENVIKKSGDVNRGDIPVYVKAINVNTLANAGETNTHFNLVDNGSGAAGFVINNVPLGHNTITAVSEPTIAAGTGPHITRVVSKKIQSKYPEWTKDDAYGYIIADALDKGLISKDYQGTDRAHYGVYAVYEGSANADLTIDTPANVEVDMTTNNGRSLITFGPENATDLANYIVEVNVNNIDAASKSFRNRTVTLGADVNRNPEEKILSALQLWSNDKSIDGAKTVVTLTWFEKGSTIQLNQVTFDVTIEAGVDKYTKVLIGRDAFVKSEQALSFKFTPLENEDDVVYIGEEVIKMSDIVEADWNLSTGAFIAQDGTHAYAWTRNGGGAYNLAA
ncbi:MAG: hypothetical protein KAH32_07525, partial [Chlamydiia bacterium]|nr:hypothetical protein [Chlamydiia bacterium]